VDTAMSQGYILVSPHELRTSPPFSELFPILPATRGAIERSIREKGFDASKPINVWRQENLVLDGHTRLLAAIAAGVYDVPIWFHEFEDEDAALQYAIANQRDRRNITGADIARCVLTVDARKKAGERTDLASTEARSTPRASDPQSRKSAEHTAKIAGTSRATVERVRSIADHAKKDPTLLNDVLQGKTTIRSAARVVDEQKRKKRKNSPAPPTTKPLPIPLAMTSPSNHAHDETVVDALSPEDDAWLARFPFRKRVSLRHFDEDALLYRAVEPLLRQIKATLIEVVGARSPASMGHLYKALHDTASVQPIENWRPCPKCKGNGSIGVACRKCRGSGYIIPGL
jgi:hypothetical protein